MAYRKDSFVSGSSVLSCNLYEIELWNYYLTYIRRDKTDRLEFVGLRTAQGSTAGKFKKSLKPEDLILQPERPKKSASDMFKKMFNLKAKGKK